MFIKISLPVFLAFSSVYATYALYDHFWTKARNSTPLKPNSIVYSGGEGNYAMDGNHDGYITVREIENYHKIDHDPEVVQYLLSLSPNDRSLVNGLRIPVAYMALNNLSLDEKKAIIKLPIRDRINLINARFEPLLKDQGKLNDL